MLEMLLRHLRGNLVAYVALLFALTSTSYAAATKLLPANSVGTKQVINGSLQRVDLSNTAIAGLRGRYTVFVGTMVAGTSVARAFCPAGTQVTGGGGSPNTWGVALSQNHPISDETGVVGYGTSSIGWQVAAVDGSNVQAYVFCAS